MLQPQGHGRAIFTLRKQRLLESAVIDDYMAREVLPHVPDAWVDHDKTKVGYEIPINRHFYVYKPPRPLDEIEADITALESEIAGLLKGLVA
jgi:type I restriction enzyme M protein